MNLKAMDMTELQKRLRYFGARARSLTGLVVERQEDGSYCSVAMGPAVEKFFNELLDSTTNPEKIRQRNEFMARAAQDPKARAALCAIRIQLFNNYLYASANIRDFFFETVNLKPDERPVYENTTMQPVKVYYTGADGDARMVAVDRDDTYELQNLRFLTTDRVRYKLMDLYRGSIVDNALQTLRLVYDMNQQMEGECFKLMQTAFGAFTFAGKKQNYPFLLSPRFRKENLPATNDLVIPGISASTNFGFTVFDVIKDYCNRWAGADPDGDMAPTGRILVPGADVSGIGKTIQPTSAKPSVPAEKILSDGWTAVYYLGTDWVCIPDNTLEPGVCYPELNRKPGTVWLKPSMDQEKTVDTPELEEKNEQERYMRKVFGANYNSAARRFFMRVAYRKAA